MADKKVFLNIMQDEKQAGIPLKAHDNGDGTWSLDIHVVDPVAVTGAVTVYGYVEDSVHVNGDAGTFILAVRNDAGAVLAGASGDYIPLTTDALGNLRVMLAAGVNNIGDVDIASIAAGETHVGQVSGYVSSIAVNPTIIATAYTANWIVGGLMTFANVNRASGLGAVLQSILLEDYSTTPQKPAGYLVIFNDNPSASTVADAGLLTIHANDKAKVKRVIPVATSDWVTVTGAATYSFCDLQGKCGGTIIPFNRTVYVVFVATGTPDFTTTSDFWVNLGFLG